MDDLKQMLLYKLKFLSCNKKDHQIILLSAYLTK
jgi:hypothetical protein